jgi:hypothetical protein
MRLESMDMSVPLDVDESDERKKRLTNASGETSF